VGDLVAAYAADALELAAADAHDRNPDFVLKLIFSHFQRASLGAANRRCPALAKNIEAYPASLPILLNLKGGRV